MEKAQLRAFLSVMAVWLILAQERTLLSIGRDDELGNNPALSER